MSMITMLQRKFVSEVPKHIASYKHFKYALGYCTPKVKNPSLENRTPVVIIDRTLLFASIYDEEEMFHLISKVPIHEICHMFDRNAEW